MNATEEPLREQVDLRCEVNPSRLLGRMRLSGEHPAYVQPDNLIELWCRECSRDRTSARADGRKVRIVHLFNLAGEFVRSEREVAR